MTDSTTLDFIGDVHGCGQSLGRLLRKLGYQHINGAYRHSERRVIFIGDLFDRGPRVRLAVQIARAMVEADQASWILGNHELDVMGLVLEQGGQPMRAMTRRASRQTQATFSAFSSADLVSLCTWLRDCPLWIDSPHWRAVHACWDEPSVRHLTQHFGSAVPGRQVADLFLDPQVKQSAELLVRGPSLPLPGNRFIQSRDGTQRKSFRVAYWVDDPDTLGDLVFQPDPLPDDLETQPIVPGQIARLPYYSPARAPLFFGHYWRRGRPTRVASNLVCLDYSAVLREKLVCYSHRPGTELSDEHFTWIESASEWD
ncbi:MAG: metallophosphoesterase [Litorivicinus sp.]